MSIKINYLKKVNNRPSTNVVLFCNEKFKIQNLKRYLNDIEFSYIENLLKNNDLKKNLLVFELNSNKKIVYLQKKSKNNSISKADISNTKKILKWKPSIKIEAGLKKILQHEKKIKN